MSTREVLAGMALAALAAGCASSSDGGANTPAKPGALGLGRVANAQEIRGWEIDVRPDGQGLPAGSGTVAGGQALYAASCASCHGPTGGGGTAPALVGGRGTLATAKPLRTVGSYWPYATTVFDYTRRTMPLDKPGSLSNDEVYALTAWLLHANAIVPADAVMDARSLAAVRMPNRDGFVRADRQHQVTGTRCMTDCASSP